MTELHSRRQQLTNYAIEMLVSTNFMSYVARYKTSLRIPSVDKQLWKL